MGSPVSPIGGPGRRKKYTPNRDFEDAGVKNSGAFPEAKRFPFPLPRVHSRQSLGRLLKLPLYFVYDRSLRAPPKSVHGIVLSPTVADDSAVERDGFECFRAEGEERECKWSTIEARGYMHARNAAAPLNQKS